MCHAIVEEYIDEVMMCPTTPDQWRPITAQFYQKSNFPHVCGALDVKHIAIRCPAVSGSTYFNYKKFYSIVLLVLMDAVYKFLWADIGGQIYNESELREATKDEVSACQPLAYRFHILSTMQHCPSTARLIVKACLVLHNLMSIRYQGLQN